LATKTVNNYMEKTIKYPKMTTIWPISDRADVLATCRKIKDKLDAYGVLSNREQAYWDKHNKIMFGRIRQNKVFS